MKAIILARISTAEQDSIWAQMDRLNNYILTKSLNVIKRFEITESSTKDTRKKFDEMIAFVKVQWEKIAIVTDTIDRLQRDFRESVMLDELRKKEVIELHFYRENLVLNKESNSADLLRWDMGVMFARSYVLQLRDNVKRKIDAKVANGEFPWKAPIGYININEDGTISIKKDPRIGKKTIIPDPERRHYVVRAFELYWTGNYSYSGIAKILRDDWFVQRNGKKIWKSTIAEIITNPFYVGEMIFKGVQRPHCYEPLITRWLYDKCQAVIAWHNRKSYKYASKDFAFKGLIQCSCCGKLLSTYYSKKAGYNYIQCHNPACRSIHVKEDDYIQQVADVFKKLRIPEAELQQLSERMSEEHNREQAFYNKSLGNLEARLKEVRGAIKNAYEDKCFSRITASEYDTFVKDWKKEETDLLEQIKDHSKADEDFLITTNRILDLANRTHALFLSSNPHQKRQILNLLFTNFSATWGKLMYKIKEPLWAVLFAGENRKWLPG